MKVPYMVTDVKGGNLDATLPISQPVIGEEMEPYHFAFYRRRQAITEDFIVIRDTTIKSLNWKAAYLQHIRSRAAATIVVTTRSVFSSGLTVAIDQQQNVIGFSDKSDFSDTKHLLCDAGLYVVNPGVLSLISDGQSVSFDQRLFGKMLAEEMIVKVFLDDDWIG